MSLRLVPVTYGSKVYETYMFCSSFASKCWLINKLLVNFLGNHCIHIGPCFRDRNQWSFDMFFAQESFKNALFLMILVCMDRAQSEELGTLYFCMCQMYIS